MARSAIGAVVAVVLLAGTLDAQSRDHEELRRELRRAESLERSGELADAEALLRSLLEEWPTEAGVVLGLERVLRRSGDLAALLPVVDRALSIDPASVIVRQVQLRALADLGRLEALRQAGAAWLEAAPSSEAAYRDYAALLQRFGQLQEAERVLRSGLGLAGRPSAIAVELGDLYLSQGRWHEAVGQWLEVMRAAEGVGWDLVQYKLESLGGDARPAAAVTLQAARDSDVPGARKLGALAAIYAERPDVARQEAQGVLDSGVALPERRAFLNLFARAAAAREQQELAAWAYRHLLGIGGDLASRVDLTRRIVQHELSMGDTVAALDAIDRGLERAERGSPVHRWAAAAQIPLLAARSDPTAERAYRRFIGQYGADADELVSLAASVAEAELRAGRMDEARRVLDSVRRPAADPAAAARLTVIRAYIDLYDGEYAAARTKLESAAMAVEGGDRNQIIRLLRILRDGGEDELAAAAEAHRLFAQGRAGDAFERLRRRLERSPPSSARPALLLWAGELALADERIDEAEAMLRAVGRDFPSAGEAPVALMTLAEILAEEGRPQEAIEALERLIIEYSSSALTPLARRRLAELRAEVPSL